MATVNSQELSTVTLSSWPSCNDCLSWSEDDLAVACGETIYILTPKAAYSSKDRSGHAQWYINSVKVNTFDESEWPYQILATMRHFSIGEEISNSLTVGLEWSSSGLGMHQRSVLAVLTSNLVLSLWETDGSLGQYKRTCVINKYLYPQDKDPGYGADRRKLRVRAFSWCPPLKADHLSRNGIHFLLLADDNDSMHLLRVHKESLGFYGHWALQHVSKFVLDKIFKPAHIESTLSPLQKRLYEQSPVANISCSTWVQDRPSRGDTHTSMHTSMITIAKGQHTRHVEVHVDVTNTMAINVTWNSKTREFTPDPGMQSTYGTCNRQPVSVDNQMVMPEDFFRKSLRSTCRDFAQQNELGNQFRVRYWGVAKSDDTTTYCACVTLHPSDMIEQTIPSKEKCTLVFEKIGWHNRPNQTSYESGPRVRKRIIQFVARHSSSNVSTNSKLDLEILHISNSLLRHHASTETGYTTLSATAETTEQGTDMMSKSMLAFPHASHSTDRLDFSTMSDAANSLNLDAQEQCEICSAPVPFVGDTESAVCTSGHQFTRCQLSFISIQEPGISKYCSRCGKQFLDLAKLGIATGPSLSHALFEEFDLCPYCQAKFRG